MSYKRQHPVKILGYTTKNFWFLSIPLLRGLFYLRFDFESWVRGAWFDILIVLFMLIFAILRWSTFLFKFDENYISFEIGIFAHKKSKLSYEKITAVEMQNRFLLIPFRASVLYLDTNSGSKRNADFILTLRKKDATAFSEVYNDYDCSDKLKYVYTPKHLHLFFFSFIFSNTLSGVILLSTLFYQGGKLVGQQLEQSVYNTFNTVTRNFSKNVPPTAVAITLLLLGGWFVSFLINLIRHWNFYCERKGNNIIVNSGFFTKHRNFLNINKINYVDLRQSFLSLLFKISSVHIHCTGYGKTKNSIAVLVPITFKREVYRTLNMLLPSYYISNVNIKPGDKQIRRFIFFPILFILIVVLITLYFLILFPSWEEIIYMGCIIFIISLIWLLIVKCISTYTTGIGVDSDFLLLKYCKMYGFHAVIVPFKKISIVKIRQSFSQKKTDNCTLVLYTNAEQTKYHTIKYLPYSEVLDFLESNNIDVFRD